MENNLELTEALKKAVEDCINENILREFLQKHGGDIVNGLLRTISMEDYAEVRAEDRAETIAENLFKDGISKEVIIKNTGISDKQMERIIKRVNKNK